MKTCRNCLKTLPPTQFYARERICKTCRKERQVYKKAADHDPISFPLARCTKCNTQFPADKVHNGTCDFCDAKEQQKLRERLSKLQKRAAETEKTCSKCNSTRPIKCFHKDSRAKDGHQSICAPCRHLLNTYGNVRTLMHPWTLHQVRNGHYFILKNNAEHQWDLHALTRLVPIPAEPDELCTAHLVIPNKGYTSFTADDMDELIHRINTTLEYFK